MISTKMQYTLSESPILSTIVFTLWSLIRIVLGHTPYTCIWIRDFQGVDAMYDYKVMLRKDFGFLERVKESYSYFSYHGIHELFGMKNSRWSSIKCFRTRTRLIYNFTVKRNTI